MISCGGTANTHESDKYPWIDDEIGLLREALADGVPVIGLCLGAQLLTRAAGGTVHQQRPVRGRLGGRLDRARRGRRRGARRRAGVVHGDAVAPLRVRPTPGAVELARNDTCLQAFRLGDAAWGTQFHIEVTRDILLAWMRWGGEELEQAGYTDGARTWPSSRATSTRTRRSGAAWPSGSPSSPPGAPAAPPERRRGTGLDRSAGRSLLRPAEGLVSDATTTPKEGV